MLLVFTLLMATLSFAGGTYVVYLMGGSVLALLAGAVVTRSENVGPGAVLLFFLFLGPSLLFPDAVWSVPAGGFFTALLLTMFCLWPTPWFKPGLSWMRRGSLDQTTLALVAITSLVSVIALALWAMWSDYLGLGSSMMKGMRTTPTWLMLGVYIPLFALVNAVAEECVYRGFIQEALRKCFPRNLALVLVVQASAFAAAHYYAGFPNGKLGYAMTFAYALMLGFLRERSRGMLAPILAHIVADFVIGLLLFLLTA
jgi:membrane protease YdiL (CAAX protease family)